MGPPKKDGAFKSGWSDFYIFFAVEALLMLTAALIRHERWKCMHRLLTNAYLVNDSNGALRAETYIAFDCGLEALDHQRNKRLRLNRASLTADLLKERCSQEHTPFSELMQADIFLALDGAVKVGQRVEDNWPRYWVPRTAVFFGSYGSLPVFLKVIDPSVRSGVRIALGVASGTELAARLAVASQKLDGFKALSIGAFSRFKLTEAANVAELIK